VLYGPQVPSEDDDLQTVIDGPPGGKRPPNKKRLWRKDNPAAILRELPYFENVAGTGRVCRMQQRKKALI
jgi:hypothetical protein